MRLGDIGELRADFATAVSLAHALQEEMGVKSAFRKLGYEVDNPSLTNSIIWPAEGDKPRRTMTDIFANELTQVTAQMMSLVTEGRLAGLRADETFASMYKDFPAVWQRMLQGIERGGRPCDFV